MKIFLILSAYMIAGAAFTRSVHAEDANVRYTWSYYSPTGITGVTDLRTKLIGEIQKLISAGHLAPFTPRYGELCYFPFWYRNADTIYTLSLAYPYLDTATQTQVKTYIDNEMRSYPVFINSYDNYLSTAVGTRRTPETLPSSRTSTNFNYYSFKDFPQLFVLYTLWQYSNSTGDWTYVNNNWSAIKTYYTNKRGEIGSYYGSIAGAIGAARLGQHQNDTAFVTSVMTDIANGLTAGANYNQFATTAENAYLITGNQNCGGGSWKRAQVFLGYGLTDLTPEIGRYMNENTTLKAAVLGTSPSDLYSLARGEWFVPLWYMGQPPTWSRFFGEGDSVGPDVKAQIFPVKAWVQKEPATQLRKYVDVPDALIGDYTYLQTLVRTIEAHGTECWENLQTTTTECPRTPLAYANTATNVLGEENTAANVSTMDNIVIFVKRLFNIK